uniref:Uncharacterized protein n=1 Tax=Vespula pensylvanica TaxID=30213 RepID=A0A834P907_VESPE|nr:hypothetical protein H0235_005178 [Vespula pensylvanica]
MTVRLLYDEPPVMQPRLSPVERAIAFRKEETDDLKAANEIVPTVIGSPTPSQLRPFPKAIDITLDLSPDSAFHFARTPRRSYINGAVSGPLTRHFPDLAKKIGKRRNVWKGTKKEARGRRGRGGGGGGGVEEEGSYKRVEEDKLVEDVASRDNKREMRGDSKNTRKEAHRHWMLQKSSRLSGLVKKRTEGAVSVNTDDALLSPFMLKNLEGWREVSRIACGLLRFNAAVYEIVRMFSREGEPFLDLPVQPLDTSTVYRLSIQTVVNAFETENPTIDRRRLKDVPSSLLWIVKRDKTTTMFNATLRYEGSKRKIEDSK